MDHEKVNAGALTTRLALKRFFEITERHCLCEDIRDGGVGDEPGKELSTWQTLDAVQAQAVPAAVEKAGVSLRIVLKKCL